VPGSAAAAVDAEALAALASHFLETHPGIRCDTPENAYTNCFAVSALFARWLRSEHAIPAGLFKCTGLRSGLRGAAGRWPHVPPETFGHWTAKIGSLSVCFTERQFDAEAPCPRIETVENLAGRWSEVAIWACEGCERLWLDDAHVLMAPAELHLTQGALARERRTPGPYPDPRHDATAELRVLAGHTVTRVFPSV
jgi:hypothetical protein